MKTRSSKFERNLLFVRNVNRLLGISPCGCLPLLVSCDCSAESCKCEPEIQVCRFETMPGFIDVEFPQEEADRVDALAESIRTWSPWLVDEMLRHHDAWLKADQRHFDERLAELLWILGPDTYGDRPTDRLSVSMLAHGPQTLARRERVESGLSPFDVQRDVDYKGGEQLTHHRNGRGAHYTGMIGETLAVLPPIHVNGSYASIKAARLEHARR